MFDPGLLDPRGIVLLDGRPPFNSETAANCKLALGKEFAIVANTVQESPPRNNIVFVV